MRFKEKTVIVTGAGRGLGRALAEAFVDEGSFVIAVGRSKPEVKGATCRTADVRFPEQVAYALKDLPPVDVLVNSAAVVGPTAPAWHIPPEAWREVIDVNLTGTFLCCRAVLPGMIERQRGAIVNLSSVASRVAYPLRTPYVASKWGIIGLTRTLAAEAGPYGVRVNAVCPGPVEGERMQRVMAERAAATGRGTEEVRAEFAAQTAQGLLVEARSVVETVLFLASEAAASVTGAAWDVDAGYRL